jgi:hypothetical protein
MIGKETTEVVVERSIEDVVLVMPPGLSSPGIELHSKGPLSGSVTKSLDQLKRDWTVVNHQVVLLLNETEKTASTTGFELDEVSFALGINASGQIGFIAGVEAGVEASITLTFKRK